MPDVTQVVDGHAAHVQTHVARLQGLKGLGLPGQGVVDLQGHKLASRPRTTPDKKPANVEAGGLSLQCLAV